MSKIIYTQEEKAIMQDVADGKYISVANFEGEKNALIQAAQMYNERKKSVTLRLATADVEKIKLMAKKEGIPYQTLISAFLHKIANGTVELNIKPKSRT